MAKTLDRIVGGALAVGVGVVLTLGAQHIYKKEYQPKQSVNVQPQPSVNIDSTLDSILINLERLDKLTGEYSAFIFEDQETFGRDYQQKNQENLGEYVGGRVIKEDVRKTLKSPHIPIRIYTLQMYKGRREELVGIVGLKPDPFNVGDEVIGAARLNFARLPDHYENGKLVKGREVKEFVRYKIINF